MLSSPARTPDITAALETLSTTDDIARGAVFTRPEVVRALLDLVGWRPEQPLHERRILEPSFGNGAFLLEIVDRLLLAYARAGGHPATAALHLAHVIRAVELHAASFAATRAAVRDRLLAWGTSPTTAEALLDAWLVHDDFLLAGLPGTFDAVVGNPPYVRQERIPAPLLAEYRRRYRTVYDRADLYVPFFERGLDLLAPGGQLGFLCANRWTKNRFGGPLREKVARDFHLLSYLDLAETDAFHSDVLAYAAITVLRRPQRADEPAPPTRVARRAEVFGSSLAELVTALTCPGTTQTVEEVAQVARGADPWLLDAAAELRLLRRLERAFPALEQAGCKVGIGVATGCDRVYLGDFEALPVEAARKLPLVLPGDLHGAEIRWSGTGLVNPFEADGSLASLETYPHFGAYVAQHREAIAGRHVAQKSPAAWYRTIDRVYPELTRRPKLLIPDLQGAATVVLDEGRYYPHHNLYTVVSDTWDLRALRAVLCSSVALLFVSAYGVRMAGGFLRFQAQYLRRVCLPRWADLGPEQRMALREAGVGTDLDVIDRAVAAAYRLSADESSLVGEIAETARVRPKGATRSEVGKVA